ncbi:MAG: V-type ATP synthase subunit D [Candidatus Omnitrophota bacterium]|jgi:V/A-type H+-transporting ATPase subunit D|nr:MAG: V-type ATP synthase subunit D [Candidatus Omnitrophota bacterium]
MGKIKLTKGELKRQRDALRQYERYLPTLQLKKQQLQMEILRQLSLKDQADKHREKKLKSIFVWAGLLAEPQVNIKELFAFEKTVTSIHNIAGVDIPVFEKAEFKETEYDLFTTPLWVDNAIEALKELISLQAEINIIDKGINILKHELRVTTQRVNLFEKVKIPESEEAIRLIKIYLGDQMTNAVGRSKMAKRKIENLILSEVAA